MIRTLLKCTLLAALAGALGCGGPSSDVATSAAALKTQKSGTFAPPTVQVKSTSPASITLTVCGTAPGYAPAGFTLQWVTQAQLDANGGVWPSGAACDASFSGNANLSSYALTASAPCVDVKVGDFLFDNGASTSCADPLECGTTYVFRAFAHATSTTFKSDFGPNLVASTAPCVSGPGCTLTQGYWKNHYFQENGDQTACTTCTLLDPAAGGWPQSVLDGGLTLGPAYTASQVYAIFWSAPANGNSFVILAHQLAAAELNRANGASGDLGGGQSIDTTIAAANAAFPASPSLPPIGGLYGKDAALNALADVLAQYNEGTIGPGHCAE